MADITGSSLVRSSLLQLQPTPDLATVTGPNSSANEWVNAALDNPVSVDGIARPNGPLAGINLWEATNLKRRNTAQASRTVQ